jgi:hypothetical protein
MKNRLGKSIGQWLLALLLFAPVLAMVLSLYGQHGMVFWDAKTVPCGIQSMLHNGNPNAYLNNASYQGACAGYGYEYMLPPGITSFLAGFVDLAGVGTLNAVYFALYAVALALLADGARRYAGNARELVLFASLIVCGVFVFEIGGGNLTIVFVGLLLGLILRDEQNRLWAPGMVLLCVAASAVKPLYALYLFIPLFAAGSWLAVAAAAAAISLGYALDATLQAAEFDRWLNLIIPVVYGEPHFGVMRLMQGLGLGAGDWLSQGGGYVLWCALVMGLLWSARPRLLTAQDRALAALLAVTLMLPRLKEYDAIVLIPLVFWLRSRLAARMQAWFQRLVVVLAFLLPALWWWVRKVGLMIAIPEPTLTQAADPGWLIATQGFFLAALLLVMFGFLVWPFRSGSQQATKEHRP